MELWIRSQDRTDLVKINALWIMDNQIWMEVPFYENHKKLGLSVTGHNHKLAEYKTKERALKVLDEIQEMIKPKIITTQYQCGIKENNKTEFDLIMNPVKTEIQELSTYIYEMPEE